ncbi:O-antigen ligase family protein [Lachnospiraceae bacterium HCP1S3_A8]|nr:O-antigen ligase family protein [Lachnospiraceae bacterium AM48-27BH]
MWKNIKLTIPERKVSVWIVALSFVYIIFNRYGWSLYIHIWPFILLTILFAVAEKRINFAFNNKLSIIGMMFCIYICISYACFSDRSVTLKYTLYHLYEVITVICLANYMIEKEDIKFLYKMYEISVWLIVIKMILQRVHIRGYMFRFTISNFGKLMDVNFLAAYMLFTAIYTFDKFIKKPNASNLILFIVPLCGILMTGSRGALLSAMLGNGILLYKNYKLTKRNIFICLLIGVLAVIVVSQLPVGMINRFSVNSLNDSSNSFRIRLWLAALKIFMSNPLFGRGAGCIYTLAEQYGGVKGMSQHNFVLEILTDYGILGLVFVGIMILICFNRMKKIKNDVGCAILIATLVACSIIPGLDSQTLWINLILLFITSNIELINKSKMNKCLKVYIERCY